MNIVITGSLGNIGKPLTQQLVQQGHSVTVVSSSTQRQNEIEKTGAKAAIGSLNDVDFLKETFAGADIVFCIAIFEAVGSLFDKHIDFEKGLHKIGSNYKTAIEQNGIKKVVHLSSIGAHTNTGNGILRLYYNVEQILSELPSNVSIKVLRPVGFYTNLLRAIQNIKTKGAIIQNFGGDKKEPWVSPLDIAEIAAEEMNKPFEGRSVRYIASEEISPNQIAKTLGEAIGNPALKWVEISDTELLNGMLSFGMNEQIALGFVEMQAAQRSGKLYEDYYRNQPSLGKVKFKDFAKQFSAVYNA